MRRAATTLLATAGVGLVALVAPGCADGTVRVAFRPEPGATYRYEVRVRSESETVLDGGAPQRRSDDVVLVAEHTVLASGPTGVRVQVVLVEPGGEQRTFAVVFDRDAQLRAIESVEGVAAEAFADLGLAELFPAAAGGPPDRALAPGDRWSVDTAVDLGGEVPPGQLTGGGRLVALDVEGGADVAHLHAETEVPVSSTRRGPDGDVLLVGTQQTELDTTRTLDDGSVRAASSVTVGRYDLAVEPPPGTTSPPVTGTLVVTVTSETRRIPGPEGG